jgi:hypothetical protein
MVFVVLALSANIREARHERAEAGPRARRLGHSTREYSGLDAPDA